MAFDMLNSRNPYAKNYKAPVNLQNLSTWTANCESLASYFLGLKDPTGSFLWENCHKTVVWGLVFSLKSLAALVTELLHKDENPVKYVLTYKFSQDHLELLFSKIRHFGGWDNNPNVLQFKYALKWLLIRNSIEPGKMGNCTPFHEALCQSNGLFEISPKRSQQAERVEIEADSEEILSCEAMLI